MKILLTCATIDEFHRIENAHDSHYPLGLGYLHSYLESLDRGYEVLTRFLNNVTKEKCMETLAKDLEEFKPDIVGISMMTHSRAGAFRFIKYLEENHPQVKIVIGGMHVSVMYRQLVEHYRNVVCAIGEGEITLGELVQCWDEEGDLNNVAGIAFYDHKKEEVVVTEERGLIDDLDILPFPKHELFLWEGKTIAGLLTSRGCPYKCNFCVLDAASRRKVRCRSAKNIVDEIEQILERHPSINTVWIHDDAFMIIKDRTIEFCEEMIRRGVKTQLICSARFRPISRQVVMLMRDAGFIQVMFGLESGSEPVMKLMKKGLTQKAVRHAMKLFAETGIKPTAFLISGLPGETHETIAETIDFVQELQYLHYLYYDDIGVASIYPGTELFTLAKEAKMQVPDYGVIDDEFWLTGLDIPFYEVDHKYEQLLEWKEQIRDAVALDRILKSPDTFLQQRKLIPQIIQYAWRFNLSGIVSEVMKILNTNQNLTLNMLRSIFLKNDPAQQLQEVRTAFEKGLIKTIISQMDIKAQKDFIVKHTEQVKKDKETLARWVAIQEKEQSGIENKNSKHSEAVVTKEGTMITPFVNDGFDDERKRKTSFNILQ